MFPFKHVKYILMDKVQTNKFCDWPPAFHLRKVNQPTALIAGDGVMHCEFIPQDETVHDEFNCKSLICQLCVWSKWPMAPTTLSYLAPCNFDLLKKTKLRVESLLFWHTGGDPANTADLHVWVLRTQTSREPKQNKRRQKLCWTPDHISCHGRKAGNVHIFNTLELWKCCFACKAKSKKKRKKKVKLTSNKQNHHDISKLLQNDKPKCYVTVRLKQEKTKIKATYRWWHYSQDRWLVLLLFLQVINHLQEVIQIKSEIILFCW